MSHRNRYFIDRDGPLTEAVLKARQNRVDAKDALSEFIREVGATKMYGSTPAAYLFDFESAKHADPKVWCTTKPFRGKYFFRPRKNTEEGRAMAARIKQLPEFPKYDDCLRVIEGLPVGFPVIIEDGRGYFPFLRYASFDARIAIVSVPWRDHEAAELEEYKRDRAAGSRFSVSLDFALWCPPTWLSEIKEWEALKIIDEEDDGKGPAQFGGGIG